MDNGKSPKFHSDDCLYLNLSDPDSRIKTKTKNSRKLRKDEKLLISKPKKVIHTHTHTHTHTQNDWIVDQRVTT